MNVSSIISASFGQTITPELIAKYSANHIALTSIFESVTAYVMGIYSDAYLSRHKDRTVLLFFTELVLLIPLSLLMTNDLNGILPIENKVIIYLIIAVCNGIS